MEQKYGEFVGVDQVHFALITTDTADAFTPGEVQYLAPVAEIAGEPEVNNKTTYYDNVAANNYVTEGKTELQVTVANVPAALMATLLGKTYDAATGRVLDAGQANPPKVALGFRFNMGTDGFRYYWYLAGTFAGGAEEAATKTSDVDEKTYVLTYTAVTTAFQWTIGGASKPLKRIFGDTADAAFDETGWFDQVQTPTAVGAPTAVAMSSIVPADNASAVAVDANIVLTFNNVIIAEAVSVIKADGTLIAAARSWDATGKILTINPSANLDASSTYIVAVNGVVDIYGQELAAAAVNFATA